MQWLSVLDCIKSESQPDRKSKRNDQPCKFWGFFIY